ncbi:MAG: CRISPR-associated endonuclease Cas2 [Firmicutes bacterium]|nr:CRISPR-associated endonuclease Cas2 [Bacillota bacterium]
MLDQKGVRNVRRYYLVCYDILDEKRLHKMHKLMQGYGDPLQFSIFRCALSEQEKALMMSDIIDVIHLREDRVMIVDLGSLEHAGGGQIEFIGKALSDPELPDSLIV